ncbi:MAG: hypothetical protein IKZ58_07345 [Selenomonadaceae bacterium]|nr:hypothetical protein [Selenomonadaceae bacterium]
MSEEKIMNDEMMSDDELGQVAGGNIYEIADDSRFLNSLNGSTDRYGATKCFLDATSISDNTEAAWAALGIKCVSLGIKSSGYNSVGNTHNKYYLNGQQISQEEARQHAMKVTGHYMTEKDWKW